eukprot:591852-Pyramimonas_sp.AAC.1
MDPKLTRNEWRAGKRMAEVKKGKHEQGGLRGNGNLMMPARGPRTIETCRAHVFCHARLIGYQAHTRCQL